MMTQTTETRQLDEPHLSITHEKDHSISLTDKNTPNETTIKFSEFTGVIIDKLLSIGNGTVPEYHSHRQFVLTETQTPVSDRLVITGTPTPTLTFTEGPHKHIVLTEESIESLRNALVDWGFTFEDIPSDVLTLPGMLQVDDGIVEPLLHQQFDHILEHYHEPVGYWSPEKNDYVYRR